jgi:hypothetical protein
VGGRVRWRIKSETANLLAVPDLRSCVVSFRDASGIRHSVEVSAESLYEAAALGIKFQNAALMPAEWGPATDLEIASRPPAVRHSITVHKLQNWLSGAGKSSREQALKSRLRELLSA